VNAKLVSLAALLAGLAIGSAWAGPQACEAVDEAGSGNQFQGVHTCPANQVVVGIHADDNRLLCTVAGCFGSDNLDFTKEYIETTYSENNMRACPPGTLMTGFHKGNNQVACVPFKVLPSPGEAIPRVVDASTNRDGMHACPTTGPSYAVGIHVGQNLLLCAGYLLNETVDTSSHIGDTHTCPTGQFMTGVHIVENRFLCSNLWSRASPKINSYSAAGMNACPLGWAMVGYNNSKNEVLCAQLSPAPRTKSPTSQDVGTQRQGMHACPPRSVLSGIDAEHNVLLCSWHP
jgi:hypothetical protein